MGHFFTAMQYSRSLVRRKMAPSATAGVATTSSPMLLVAITVGVSPADHYFREMKAVADSTTRESRSSNRNRPTRSLPSAAVCWGAKGLLASWFLRSSPCG